ncbi:hypothetical protein IAQ67_14730 [Paenibacillus peoriae]|uniref:Uncharacterized protein n=1 Tax=Paenibacillus peoriae TaxID=59893 RepID=A0A7H0Y261_9BACL|nr:hypothetical protein [Paenibacillus peoriae]QNR65169.1 hypothetical protein IAQ67_14730 [Paenibacillus peoriae]
MFTRITFDNFGTVEHMFIKEGEIDAIQSWENIWGKGIVSIINIGQAIDSHDFGGFVH